MTGRHIVLMWNGKEISEYDYIGRHMGYRFTVTHVKISKNVITLTIKNTASPICAKRQSAG